MLKAITDDLNAGELISVALAKSCTGLGGKCKYAAVLRFNGDPARYSVEARRRRTKLACSYDLAAIGGGVEVNGRI